MEFGAGNQRLLDALGVAVVQVGQVERLHHVESSALARSAELELPEFHLVPLGAQRNESDHAAWASSSAHIRATPGFESSGWPPVEGMSLDANRGDLEGHARDFAERTGFTFTVLRPGTEEVIGCLYIYPVKDGGGDAEVRSWVRADVAELDGPLHAAVSRWLVERWPFERVIYADRPMA